MKKLWAILLFLFLYPGFILALDKVEINTASLEDLDKIVGIGPALAQIIIDARPFSSVNDLLRVKGIGEKTLQNIKDQGLAYVGEKSETQNSDLGTASNSQNLNIQNTATTPAPALETNYPGNIFFNEILPSPKGADETDEWFELFNANSFDVDLSGWKIEDTTGTVSKFTIPKNTTIAAGNYLVFKRPETKIILNNDGDGLKLLKPDKTLAVKITFPKAPTGQSYNKTAGASSSSWAWSTILTPGSKNIISGPQNKENLKGLPKTENSVKKEDAVAGLANVSQNIFESQKEFNNTRNPWFLFFIALTITVILAIVVLFIKLRFMNVTKP